MVEMARRRGFRIDDECFFRREQLAERDYDPISAGDIDLASLQERYPHHVNLDHAAAGRGQPAAEGGCLEAVREQEPDFSERLIREKRAHPGDASLRFPCGGG